MAQIGSKTARAIKNEPKCKLCRHEAREHIDQLLLARSMRERDPATGQPINLQFVLDALAGLGVENPTEENCKTHFRKHVEVIDAEAAEAMDAAVAELYAELIAEMPDEITPANAAEWIGKAYFVREKARLKAGEAPSVTTDQVLAAMKVIQSEKSDQATRQLIGGVAVAIGGAMKSLAAGGRQALPPVIEDAEFEVVDA